MHYMLHTTPEAKAVLVSYLKDLRTNPHPKTISHRLRSVLPEYDTKFVSYISQLQPATSNVARTAGDSDVHQGTGIRDRGQELKIPYEPLALRRRSCRLSGAE